MFAGPKTADVLAGRWFHLFDVSPMEQTYDNAAMQISVKLEITARKIRAIVAVQQQSLELFFLSVKETYAHPVTMFGRAGVRVVS